MKQETPLDQISIIIPALNEEHYLPKVLSALSTQNFNGALQVIVVDGGSVDGTIECAKQFHSKFNDLFVMKSERGLGRQRNAGAAQAKYEHILFLDSDMYLPPNFLNRFVKKVNKDEQLVSLIFQVPVRFNFLDYLWVFLTFGFVLAMSIWDTICAGTFLFTTKTTHLSIGGFDEGIVMGEDVDYGRRAVASGARYRIFFYPYVYASVRRLREVGRLRLMWYWFKGYVHILKHGPLYQHIFPYQFGEHRPVKGEK